MGPIATSPQGDAFTIDRESCPERAYKDVGGVVTIGPGFTMLSKSFAEFWRKSRGHDLRVGDVLPRAEALKIFHSIINEEYTPAVVRNIAPEDQHVLDGSVDVAWNAGVGSTMWNWARALRAKQMDNAMALLRKTAITVHGVVVQGLINRRAAEVALIAHGDYGLGILPTTEGGSNVASGISMSVDEVKEYQADLKTLGYYKGDIDGVGNLVKGSLTMGAVMNFQRSVPGYKVDGRVGPATRAAIKRALASKTQGKAALGGATVSGGGLVGIHLDWWWVALGAAVVVIALIIAFWAWNNRGAILRQRTPA